MTTENEDFTFNNTNQNESFTLGFCVSDALSSILKGFQSLMHDVSTKVPISDTTADISDPLANLDKLTKVDFVKGVLLYGTLLFA